jgi:hypothetical protein
VESALTSSLGGRGASEPRGGACARASGAAAASDEEWSRRRSSGLRRGEKGKKIRQRREWRSLRHVCPGGKTHVGRPVSSISAILMFYVSLVLKFPFEKYSHFIKFKERKCIASCKMV